jgi:hypothetical protein
MVSGHAECLTDLAANGSPISVASPRTPNHHGNDPFAFTLATQYIPLHVAATEGFVRGIVTHDKHPSKTTAAPITTKAIQNPIDRVVTKLTKASCCAGVISNTPMVR